MEEKTGKDNPCIFIIYGATGDLTKRKLIPALFTLYTQNKLPYGFAVIAIGRRKKSETQYRDEMRDFIEDSCNEKINQDKWKLFSSRVFYKKADFLVDEEYEGIKKISQDIDKRYKTKGNRIYYLAVAPEYFELIIEKLDAHGMLKNKISWQRVMIEKPFGSDLKTAKELNRKITKILGEDKIFRIDHYLGKEMIQNIMSLRFGNTIFEPLWNHNYIDNIQIISTETIGIENRGAYYETTGIIKDMLQNHILQMLSLIAMEPPSNLGAEAVRDEKVKVLQAMRPLTKESAKKDVVKGQYGKGIVNGKEVSGYRDEERVSPDTDTDTFIALKLCIDNFRWGEVPFYIFAGKRMKKKTTKIVIHFKKLPGINFYKDFKDTKANVLVIKIQPEEGLFFQINAKKPGNDYFIGPVEMNYCQNCDYEENSPEAYERLILDAINNNPTLFTRWDELEYSWKYVENLEEVFRDIESEYPNYKAGSKGPEEAFLLIERDGRKWWDKKEKQNENI